MKGCWAGGLVIALALGAATATPFASASTVRYAGDYLAAPGETNHISAERQDSAGTFTYTDTGVSSIDISPTSTCTASGNQATCPLRPSFVFEVFSGDMDDTISDSQPGLLFNLYGGSGNDQLTKTGFGVADGGPGNDLLVGASGSQALIGDGNRDDTGDYASAPPTPPNDDRLIGKDGVDFLIAGPGADSLDAGDGNDELEGGDGNDTEIAGPGDDNLDFSRAEGGGADVLDGGEGNDTIVGSYDAGAPDTISCGPGIDRTEIGVNDSIDSGCEQVEQLVSCPGEAAAAGPCHFTVVVSARRAPSGNAASAARNRRGKRVTLGVATAGVRPGRTKPIDIRLNPRAFAAILKKRASVHGLLDTKVSHRKQKRPKSLSRTRFDLTR